MGRVEDILARFPGPVTLTPSRRKWLGVLAGSTLFVIAAFFMLRDPSVLADGNKTFWAWSGLVFFGACAIVAALMLAPGAGGLKLSADGFEVTSLYRRVSTRWQRVSDFAVGSIRGRRMVAYNSADITGTVSDMNRAMIGRDASLPDTYGFSHDDLTRLMTEWRARALAATAVQVSGSVVKNNG